MIDKIIPDDHFFTQPKAESMRKGKENSREIHEFLSQIKDEPSYRMTNVHVRRQSQ